MPQRKLPRTRIFLKAHCSFVGEMNVTEPGQQPFKYNWELPGFSVFKYTVTTTSWPATGGTNCTLFTITTIPYYYYHYIFISATLITSAIVKLELSIFYFLLPIELCNLIYLESCSKYSCFDLLQIIFRVNQFSQFFVSWISAKPF